MDGSYTVTLTVTDDGGKTGNTSQTVSVSGPAVNAPPTAAFTFNCSDLSCDFTDQSSDDNGVTSWNWTFGTDGGSNAQNPTHTFSSAGTYTVTLEVGDGQYTDSTSQSVTVSESTGGPTLDSNSISVRNKWTAQVFWSDGSNISGTWSTGDRCEPTTTLCELTGINKNVGSVTFTEDGGETITVLKP